MGEHDVMFKLLVIGDAGVGKSALMNKYVNDTFDEAYIATIGINCMIKTIEHNDNGRNIKLQMWDTSGQERFRTITQSYYRGTDGVLILFDLSNAESFKNVPSWIKEVHELARENTPITLVGNKSDLPSRTVDKNQAETFALEQEMSYVETNAKDEASTSAAFQSLIDKIIIGRAAGSLPIGRNAMASVRNPNDGKRTKMCSIL